MQLIQNIVEQITKIILKIFNNDCYQIFNKQKLVYTGSMSFENTFGGVAVGKPLAYLNSLMDLSFALNQGSFADKYHIQTGNDWNVTVNWAK